MNFTHHDLGTQSAGRIVEVRLSGSAANVRLLDSMNFQAYRNGRDHRYHGGHATRSPVHIPIPASGQWHVVVDLGGYSGTVRSSARVLPGKLAPSPSVASAIADVGDNLAAMQGLNAERDFDVFISHASEDKDSFVRSLADALRSRGLSVWYDEFELRVGDSLRRKIDAGLARSRFGVIVLSTFFFQKNWAQYELGDC